MMGHSTDGAFDGRLSGGRFGQKIVAFPTECKQRSNAHKTPIEFLGILCEISEGDVDGNLCSALLRTAAFQLQKQTL